MIIFFIGTGLGLKTCNDNLRRQQRLKFLYQVAAQVVLPRSDFLILVGRVWKKEIVSFEIARKGVFKIFFCF